MNREERAAKITRLCDYWGCSDKLRKIHFDQFVDRQWHPHPSKAFTAWWKHHKDCTTLGYEKHRTKNNAIVAFNAACYYDQFCDARDEGILDERPVESNEAWRERKRQDNRGFPLEEAVKAIENEEPAPSPREPEETH